MPLAIGDFVLCVLPDMNIVARKVADITETGYTLDYPVNGVAETTFEMVVQTNFAIIPNPVLEE